MRDGSGGTKMWCPSCELICACAAIPGANVTNKTKDYSQRFYHAAHADLNWFQRGRRCLNCDHQFLTGEMDLDFLWELAKLRDALSEIKTNAETYAEQSQKASTTLKKLSDSLKVLKALEIYKKTSISK